VVYQRSAGRLRDMQASTRGNMSGDRLLEALEQDVARLRTQVRRLGVVGCSLSRAGEGLLA
jgi:hypothetical protein